MATRKKTALSAVARWEKELPPTLRDYANLVRRQLSTLEKQVEQARADVRRAAMRIMRMASYRLGVLEERGEGAWLRLTVPYRREAVRVLQILEKAVAPPKQAVRRAKRKTTKKKASKKASKTTAAKRSTKKVAKRSTKKKATKRVAKSGRRTARKKTGRR
jgi:hypothetical protein